MLDCGVLVYQLEDGSYAFCAIKSSYPSPDGRWDTRYFHQVVIRVRFLSSLILSLILFHYIVHEKPQKIVVGFIHTQNHDYPFAQF